MSKISGQFQISGHFWNFRNFRTAGTPELSWSHPERKTMLLTVTNSSNTRVININVVCVPLWQIIFRHWIPLLVETAICKQTWKMLFNSVSFKLQCYDTAGWLSYRKSIWPGGLFTNVHRTCDVANRLRSTSQLQYDLFTKQVANFLVAAHVRLSLRLHVSVVFI